MTIDLILKDYAAGLTAREVSQKYGITKDRVLYLARKKGIYHRPRYSERWAKEKIFRKLDEIVGKYGYLSRHLLDWENLYHILIERKLLPQVHEKYKAFWPDRTPKTWGEPSRRGRKYEQLACEKILPNEGFTQIILTREIHHGMPFNIIAKRKGELAIIKVTNRRCGEPRQKTTINIKFAKALNLNYYSLHIHPEGERYILKKIYSYLEEE